MHGFVALVEGGEVSVGWRGLACSERNNAEHALELSKSKKKNYRKANYRVMCSYLHKANVKCII